MNVDLMVWDSTILEEEEDFFGAIGY